MNIPMTFEDMSEELPIGPNSCFYCGGEYGEHQADCRNAKKSNTEPTITTRDRKILKEILFQAGIEYLPQQKFDKCATILAAEREKERTSIRYLLAEFNDRTVGHTGGCVCSECQVKGILNTLLK